MKHMVTSSIDKTLKLWSVPENLQTTEGEKSPGNPSPSIRKPTWHPAFAEKMLSKQEIYEKLLLRSFETDSEVLVCRFSHNGKYLAAGCLDGSAYIWDLSDEDYKLLQQSQGHELGIEDCAFIDDDSYLATCSQDKSVIIWSVEDFTQVHLATNNKNMVLSCCFQPGTRRLAYCTENKIYVSLKDGCTGHDTESAMTRLLDKSYRIRHSRISLQIRP
jgi:WD40 repeat protein